MELCVQNIAYKAFLFKNDLLEDYINKQLPILSLVNQ